MKKTNTIVWHITRGYRSLLVWEGNQYGQRGCRLTIIPRKDMTRIKRYEELCRRLIIIGCKPPVYVPTKSESK